MITYNAEITSTTGTGLLWDKFALDKKSEFPTPSKSTITQTKVLCSDNLSSLVREVMRYIKLVYIEDLLLEEQTQSSTNFSYFRICDPITNDEIFRSEKSEDYSKYLNNELVVNRTDYEIRFWYSVDTGISHETLVSHINSFAF